MFLSPNLAGAMPLANGAMFGLLRTQFRVYYLGLKGIRLVVSGVKERLRQWHEFCSSYGHQETLVNLSLKSCAISGKKLSCSVLDFNLGSL